MKKRIKARLREKKATLPSREVVNYEYHHEVLANTPEKQTTLLQDNDMAFKTSRLPTIIDRLWRMNTKVIKPDKVNSPLHVPCYLQRNIKAVKTKKRSTSTELTPKRKKKRQNIFYAANSSRKKLKTATNADFYFRFKKDPTEYSYTFDNNKTLTSASYEKTEDQKGLFESELNFENCFNSTLKDTCTDNNVKVLKSYAGDQRQYVSFFSKTPKLWKSLVRENNQYPDETY